MDRGGVNAAKDGQAAVVAGMQKLVERGLVRGTAGNISQRRPGGMSITPSGIAPDALRAEQIVTVRPDGSVPEGQLRPSSEWRMHLAIYRRRPDVGAVVHCHSRHATILACTGRAIPAIHYMVAAAGVKTIPCVSYARYGSPELADAVVEGLATGSACLLAHHGQVAAAVDLERALLVAEEVEEQAALYWGALAIGGARCLSDAQMDAVLENFASYGQG